MSAGRGRGLVYMLLPLFAAITWASNIVVGRFLVGGGVVDGIRLSFLRFLVATPLMGVALALLHGLHVPRGGLRYLAIAGLLGVASFNVLLYTSLGYISAATVSFIASTATPFTYILAAIVGRESLRPLPLAGVGVSIVGVYILLREGIAVWGVEGVILALLAALSWSLYTIVVDRIQGNVEPVDTLFWTMFFGTLALAPLGLDGLGGAVSMPMYAWLLILYVAVVPGIMGYLAWNLGVERLGPALPSIFIPLIPLMATIMEVYLLGAELGGTTIVGGALIILGVSIVVGERVMGRR